MFVIKLFPLKWLSNDNFSVFVSFQETEEDLNESDEYKEAKNILDSVKLDLWFQTL